jgi:hypothetical protein
MFEALLERIAVSLEKIAANTDEEVGWEEKELLKEDETITCVHCRLDKHMLKVTVSHDAYDLTYKKVINDSQNKVKEYLKEVEEKKRECVRETA